MGIENNQQAVATMQNIINSLDNRFRAVYNYGYKDGYADGLKDATGEIIKKILEEQCGERREEGEA